MPNDEQENHRLDLTHALMVKTIGGQLYRAPIDFDKALRILDVGTGTGICKWPFTQFNHEWLANRKLGAIAVADLYPNAEV